MSVATSSAWERPPKSAPGGTLRLLVAVGGTISVGLALLWSGVVPFLFAAVAGAAGLVYLLRRPDSVAAVFAFVLYTNAAVIADRFHGVPTPIAAAYPLLLLIPIARDLALRGRSVVVGPVVPYLVAFGAVQFAGALLSVQPESSMEYFAAFVVEGLVLFLLVTNAIRTPESLQHAIDGLLAAGTFIGAIVTWQQLTGSFDNDYGGFAQLDDGGGFQTGAVALADAARQRRLAGPIGEANRFAQVMVVLVPLAMFRYRACRSLAGKLACVVALALILVGSSFAFSRGAALSLGLMLAAMVVRGHIPVRRAAMLGACAAALVLVAAPQFLVRLSTLGDLAGVVTNQDDPGMQNADGSTQGRITEMVTAALIFGDHPILGVGPKMYPQHYVEYARIAGGRARAEERQPHNLALQIASENGILGLAAMTGVFWVTFRTLARARRRWLYLRPDLVHSVDGLGMALVVYLATSLFLHASYIRYFWFVLSLAAATGAVVAPEERSALAPILRAIRARAR